MSGMKNILLDLKEILSDLDPELRDIATRTVALMKHRLKSKKSRETERLHADIQSLERRFYALYDDLQGRGIIDTWVYLSNNDAIDVKALRIEMDLLLGHLDLRVRYIAEENCWILEPCDTGVTVANDPHGDLNKG